MMRGILFDLDGVFYVGERLIEGAPETLAWCAAQNIPYLFITNTTSRPPRAIGSKLAALGIHTDEGMIMSPPVAAVDYLRRHGLRKVSLYISESTRQLFTDFEIVASDAVVDAVIIGDMGEGWHYAVLNRALRQLMHVPAPQLLALGMTRYWQAPDGLRLDAGAFVAAFEYASGVKPVVLGKPAVEFFHSATARLELTANEVLMIGDDIRGDIAGAQAAGLHAVLVRTGKFRETDLQSDIRPDAVLDSIADLPAWWASRCG